MINCCSVLICNDCMKKKIHGSRPDGRHNIRPFQVINDSMLSNYTFITADSFHILYLTEPLAITHWKQDVRLSLTTPDALCSVYCAVSFVDDCVTSSNTSSTAIQLSREKGYLALYPAGTESSRSDCYWSLEAPAGRTIVVAWKISLGGWTSSAAKGD